MNIHKGKMSFGVQQQNGSITTEILAVKCVYFFVVPWITSGPEDVGGSLHQGLALDCEVKGYPIPGVHWEFKANDDNTIVLPSKLLY